jgi:hypothetical protein
MAHVITQIQKPPEELVAQFKDFGAAPVSIAAKNADLAEREMVSHLFDVVRRIESNLKIDLNLETMFGVDLIHPSQKKNTTGRRLKPK